MPGRPMPGPGGSRLALLPGGGPTPPMDMGGTRAAVGGAATSAGARAAGGCASGTGWMEPGGAPSPRSGHAEAGCSGLPIGAGGW